MAEEQVHALSICPNTVRKTKVSIIFHTDTLWGVNEEVHGKDC